MKSSLGISTIWVTSNYFNRWVQEVHKSIFGQIELMTFFDSSEGKNLEISLLLFYNFSGGQIFTLIPSERKKCTSLTQLACLKYTKLNKNQYYQYLSIQYTLVHPRLRWSMCNVQSPQSFILVNFLLIFLSVIMQSVYKSCDLKVSARSAQVQNQ